MKKILLKILLFSCLNVKAQYTKHILTSGSGYPSANNIAMAFGVHIPPVNPNGKKHMIFIFLHGQGERGPRGDTTTSSGLAKVATVSLPYMVRDTNIGRFVALGGGATDSLGVIVVFPQCSTEFGAWPEAYEEEMIKYAKANLASVGDTNMIVVCGLSQGGGGTLGGFKRTYTRENVSARFSVCPGYYAYTNREDVADSMCVTYIYHAQNDPTATIANSVGMVNSTNVYRPLLGYQFFVFSGATPGFSGHNIWDEIFKTTGGTQAVLANGDIYVHIPIYVIAAGIRKQRYKRP